MKHKSYQRLTKKWVNELTNGEQLAFEELIERSKSHERLRNACVFYALSDRKKMNKLRMMAVKDKQVNQMIKDLYVALSVPGVNHHKTRSVARMLKHMFFTRPNGLFVERQVEITSASRDMAKFLHSLVWEDEYGKRNVSTEKQNYIQDRMGQFKSFKKPVTLRK